MAAAMVANIGRVWNGGGAGAKRSWRGKVGEWGLRANGEGAKGGGTGTGVRWSGGRRGGHGAATAPSCVACAARGGEGMDADLWGHGQICRYNLR